MKNRVRELRNKYNMTQQQLADAVYVSARTIISLEQGQYNPSIMLAYRITIIFATTIEDLYCLEENKREEDTHHDD